MNYLTSIRRLCRSSIALILTILLLIQPSNAAEVIVDRPVLAGELTLFQSAYDDTAFYYMADKPVLSTSKSGVPKFSFLQYVRGAREEQITGGGIVHAVVKLGVTEGQIRIAERELKKKKGSSARLLGAIPFRDGKISLVSTLARPDGSNKQVVVGLGAAPALENEEIAVAASLPKEGAEILYASLQTPAPDFSISFEMSIDGFNSPIEAEIEAEWGKIYSNEEIKAAAITPIFGAELQTVFEKLRKTQVIKIKNLGSDPDMSRAINMAYEKILKEAFEPIEATSPSSLMPKAASGSSGSLLDRATKMLDIATGDAKKKIAECRKSEDKKASVAQNTKKHAGESKAKEKPPSKASDSQKNAKDNKVKKVAENGGNAKGNTNNELSKKTSDKEGKEGKWDWVKDFEASPNKDSPASSDGSESQADKQNLTEIARLAVRAEQQNANLVATTQEPSKPDLCEEISMPAFAATASYSLKKIRHSGTFSMNLQKYHTTTFPTRFDLNVTDINRCAACIQQVNVDSPLNEPRDIFISIGGQVDSTSFDTYLNTADVSIRKKHQNGDITNRSVVVNKEVFNEKGNNFRVRYLWHDDQDRSEWTRYEYKVTWNLFNGLKIETDWQSSDSGSLVFTPPIVAKIIDIEVPAGIVAANQIRAVDVTTKTKIGHNNDVTLKVFRDELSKQHTVFVSREDPEYEYSVVWQTANGNRELGPFNTSSTMIFVDRTE